jgi:hypothetical protein
MQNHAPAQRFPNLIYPDLNLDLTWCPGHDIPMRMASGQRGQFWGCPKFPECRHTANYVPPPPEVAASAREKRKAELLSVYKAIDEDTKLRIQKEIERECERMHVLPTLLDEMPIIVAAKFMKETK